MRLSYAELFLWEIDVLLQIDASDYEIARHCKLEGSTQMWSSMQFLLSGIKLRTCINFLQTRQ